MKIIIIQLLVMIWNWILQNDLYFNLNTSNEKMSENDIAIIKQIFLMDDIRIYMSRPTLFDIPDNTKIRFDDAEIVTGGSGYNTWWKSV